VRVLLAHDRLPDTARSPGLPEDFGAEYDDEATIRSLLAAIRANGHEALDLVLDERFPRRVREIGPDLVFNIAEGVRGPMRESLVPGWLDELDIPYTGSDGLTLAISLDKALTKSLAAGAGVRTPAFRRVAVLSDLDALDLEFPLFVKPNAEGSCMGIRYTSLVRDADELRRQVGWVLEEYREDCLVEEFCPGSEYCVGILGNGELQVLPILEVRSPREFYSYEDKHVHRRELVCPADLPRAMAEEMQAMAVEVYRGLRCRDLARMDFKMDRSGRPAFLEANPLPGLSVEYGMFPVQARAAGYTYEGLIGRIVELALERTRRPTEARSR